MSRNYEKNFSQLNRLFLAEQEKKKRKEEPRRPPLRTLKTAAEIRYWLPTLKREIFICLKHLSGVRNYRDSKIKEFEERLEELRGQWRAWVKKLLEIEPIQHGIPGEPRGYVSKRKMQQSHNQAKRTKTNELQSEYSFDSNEDFTTFEDLETYFVEEENKMKQSSSFQEDNDPASQEFLVEEEESTSKLDTFEIPTPLLDKEAKQEKQKKPQVAYDDPSQTQPLQFNFPQHNKPINALSALIEAYASDSD